MSTSLVSVRLRVSKSIFAAILVLMSCVAAFSQQANSHPPQIWLSEPQSLSVNHVSALAAPLRTAPSRAAIAGGVSDPVATVTTGAANLGQPVSMSSADFDEDGVSDLVVGYKGAQGASIAIHRGNLDAFAPHSDASFQAIGRGEFPSPFVTDAQVIGVPLAPDFIVTGNFAGNGHKDIVVASPLSSVAAARDRMFCTDSRPIGGHAAQSQDREPTSLAIQYPSIRRDHNRRGQSQ